MSAPVGLRWGLLLSVLLAIVGIVLGCALTASTFSDHDGRAGHNIFYGLFAEHEPIACGLSLLGLAVLAWIHQRGFAWRGWDARRPVLWLAAMAVAVSVVGTFSVCHRFGLSMDEYAADFQATIFAQGKVTAAIPEEWQPLERWLRPGFIQHDKEKHTWMAPYLPVYAAMRTVFLVVSAPWLLNPLLAGVSVLAIAGIARRLWPESQAPTWLAAALLASSPQFLVTSMTAYSMPAHLAFNLVWLWLYVRQDKAGLALAPLLGLFAVGLHQPNVHLLFAFPFCARLVWERRWGWVGYYAAVYGLALFTWWSWWHWLRPDAVAVSGGMMTAPNIRQGLIQILNLVLIHSWQSVGTLVLVALGLSRWKTLPPVLRDAAWSCALTFVFYFAFNSHQGHGWGYRYFHPVLGNWVLLAAAGWVPLCELFGAAQARTLAAASIAMSLALGLPLRAFQVESFVRPFADADEALRHVKADVVLIPPFAVWYGHDLVRNDPLFRETPKRARMVYMRQGVTEAFKSHGRVVVASGKDLERFGLRSVDSEP